MFSVRSYACSNICTAKEDEVVNKVEEDEVNVGCWDEVVKFQGDYKAAVEQEEIKIEEVDVV